MFSHASIELLRDNGYKVKQSEDQISFHHSNTDRYLYIVFGFIMSVFCLFLMIFSPVFGLILLVAIILITLKAESKTKGKTCLTLYPSDRRFDFTDRKSGKITCLFEEVDEISFHSRFFEEYSSATKPTSQEFIHDVYIQLKTSQKIHVFRLEGSYLEPTEQETALVEELKNMFHSGAQSE